MPKILNWVLLIKHLIRSVLLLGALSFSVFTIFPQHVLAQGHDSLFIEMRDINQKATILPTEIHIGLGIQNLLSGGFRQKIFHDFLLEANIGYFNLSGFEVYSYGLGISWIPSNTQKNPGLIGSLLFSEWGDNSLFTNKFISYRILTANVGYLIQHSEGLSFLARVGIGVQQQNSQIWDYTLGWDIRQPPKYLTWLNLEITVGFAFDFSPKH